MRPTVNTFIGLMDYYGIWYALTFVCKILTQKKEFIFFFFSNTFLDVIN